MDPILVSRINDIQKTLKVPLTGIFDLPTCKAYEALKKINTDAADLLTHKKEIQKFLGFTGKDVDGDIGKNSITKIELSLQSSSPTLPVEAVGTKLRTLIIGAGHGGTDPGASGNGFIERDLAIEFRNLLVAEMLKLSVTCIVDDNKNALKASLAVFKKDFKPDSVNIDIHWNAGPAAATGTEVLIKTNAGVFDKQLAGKIAATIANTLGIKNRGLKTELDSARGSLAWLHQPGSDFIIEMCFISNKSDMDKYQATKTVLAKLMANDIFEALKK